MDNAPTEEGVTATRILIAGVMTVLPEWTVVLAKFGGRGVEYGGYLWRVALLSLIPLLGILIASRAPSRFRLGGSGGGVREPWPLALSAGIHFLLFGSVGAFLWVYLNFVWVDLDLNLWLPWVRWQSGAQALVSTVPVAFLGGAWLGLALALLDPVVRKGQKPLLLRSGRTLAAVAGFAGAALLATRPAGFKVLYDWFLRGAVLLCFVLAIRPSNLRAWRAHPALERISQRIVLLGGLGGVAIMALELASISNDSLAILDQNRPVSVELVRSLDGNEGESGPYICPSGAAHSGSVPERTRPPEAPTRDVLLVTIDALSSTVAAVDNPAGSPMPTLARLASRGVDFPNAMSSGPRTAFGLTALHLSQDMGCAAVTPSADDQPLFAQLSAHGYQTAFAASFELDINRSRVVPHAETLLQGVDTALYAMAGARSLMRGAFDSDVTANAKRLVAQADSARPLALWVHYFNPHALYNPPQDFQERGWRRLTRYRSELRATDAELADLLASLRDLRPHGNPLIVVSGDHGQAFAPLGPRFQTTDLFGEMIRTPLVFRNLSSGARRLTTPVSLLDVAPTILHSLGIEIPSSFQGRSLLPLLAGEDQTDRPVRFDMWPSPDLSEGVVLGPYKLVRRLRPGYKRVYGRGEIFELYRWERDPLEMVNLADDMPDVVSSLKVHLPRETYRARPDVRWCGRTICPRTREY